MGALASGGTTETGRDSSTSGMGPGSCDSIATLPAAVVPVCNCRRSELEGIGHFCSNANVTVYGDGTNYYIVPDIDQRIIRCPMDASDSGLLATDTWSNAKATVAGQHVLYYQMVANGLLGFRCDELDNYGPSYRHRYFCSFTGVQIYESDPKGDELVVIFPDSGAGHGSAGYVGAISPYWCLSDCSSCSITFYPRPADGSASLNRAGDLGTHPITCSSDLQTLTFNDLDGLPLSIQVLPQSNSVVDVRR
jgi:hypothetical protein